LKPRPDKESTSRLMGICISFALFAILNKA
jgi:hypothetical protein